MKRRWKRKKEKDDSDVKKIKKNRYRKMGRGREGRWEGKTSGE